MGAVAGPRVAWATSRRAARRSDVAGPPPPPSEGRGESMPPTTSARSLPSAAMCVSTVGAAMPPAAVWGARRLREEADVLRRTAGGVLVVGGGGVACASSTPTAATRRGRSKGGGASAVIAAASGTAVVSRALSDRPRSAGGRAGRGWCGSAGASKSAAESVRARVGEDGLEGRAPLSAAGARWPNNSRASRWRRPAVPGGRAAGAGGLVAIARDVFYLYQRTRTALFPRSCVYAAAIKRGFQRACWLAGNLPPP